MAVFTAEFLQKLDNFKLPLKYGNTWIWAGGGKNLAGTDCNSQLQLDPVWESHNPI